MTAAQRGSRGGVQRDLIATESFESLDAIDSYAADFCEVEVDMENGQVQVVDFLAVHNSGRVINPMLFEGQVHGGIHMGLGYALSEEMIISPATGEVKNPNFKKYHMLTAGRDAGDDLGADRRGPGGGRAVRREEHRRVRDGWRWRRPWSMPSTTPWGPSCESSH